VDVAIGVAGMEPIDDLRGQTDTFGKVLEVSEVAVVDEIAAAADLVMGKANGIPAAIVRGVSWKPSDAGIGPLLRPPEEDMFR
jgi:coenzyme F420-0:L-glutamate ligase / coenzyme F420-1:gamma-L-glutamate ligase